MPKEYDPSRRFFIVPPIEPSAELVIGEDEKEQLIESMGSRIAQLTYQSSDHTRRRLADGGTIYARSKTIKLPHDRQILLIYNLTEEDRHLQPTAWMASAYFQDTTYEVETGLFGVSTIRRLIVGKAGQVMAFESCRLTSDEIKEQMLQQDSERIIPQQMLDSATQLGRPHVDSESITRQVTHTLRRQLLEYRFQQAEQASTRRWFRRKRPFTNDQSP